MQDWARPSPVQQCPQQQHPPSSRLPVRRTDPLAYNTDSQSDLLAGTSSRKKGRQGRPLVGRCVELYVAVAGGRFTHCIHTVRIVSLLFVVVASYGQYAASMEVRPE